MLKNVQSARVKILIFFFLLGGTFVAPEARAASLGFSDNSGTTYQVGQTVSETVLVSSTDQSINAVSGTITYPSDKLEAISISKVGSIINLWAQDPTASSGQVDFEGVILNPGYQGSAGKIITIVFKVKAAGIAPLLFSSASVLANDGKGTNVLNAVNSTSLRLDSAGSQSAGTSSTDSAVLGTPS